MVYNYDMNIPVFLCTFGVFICKLAGVIVLSKKLRNIHAKNLYKVEMTVKL